VNNLLTNIPSNLSQPLQNIITFFKEYNPKVKLYLVGGAVRDMVMGREVYDLDIECFGIDPKAFDDAMQKLGAKGVGKSFFVYKYGSLDLALPRVERKVGEGHRAFEVELAYDTKEASRRRDFTMNALMLDLKTGKIVDHWGGLEDIKHRLIRVVDAQKFQEDSLRVLRAMQFSARLKFKIEPQSLKIMQAMDLSDLTHERIFWEFEKLFHAPWLHYGLYAIMRLQIDRKILGRTIPKEAFFSIAYELQKARYHGNQALSPYYFLYVLANALHTSELKLCETIHTPNHYKKLYKTQKHIPKQITDRFLGALALRYPIKGWLGNYRSGIRERAQALHIYDKPFDPKVRPADLIKEGYQGKALGKVLRERSLQAIRQNFRALS